MSDNFYSKKRWPRECRSAPVLLNDAYLSWKITGKVYDTFTARSLWRPGSHLGELFTTLTASLSSAGSTPRSTFTSETLPSGLTVNWSITLPETPFSLATSGYSRCLFTQAENALGSPPWNLGLVSTNWKGIASSSTTSSAT